MNCINLKQKLDRTLFCKQKKCIIKLSECNNCPYKIYKTKNIENSLYKQKYTKLSKNSAFQEKKSPKMSKNMQIKKKTSKLAKMERERFSLFTDNDSECMLCGSTYELTWNEIFRGKNRQLSMKYGLCQRLCLECHKKYQDDPIFNEIWHKKGQAAFSKSYPELNFLQIFGRNYLK